MQVTPFIVRSVSLLILLSMCGCSTVTEGTAQRITVDTVPEGAACVLKSNDNVIATIESTPAVIKVDKSKYDIIAECTKQGYVKTKIRNRSEFAATSLGNFAFMQFGFVGNLVDSATGAANKYDTRIYVELEKDRDMNLTQQQPQQQNQQAAALLPGQPDVRQEPLATSAPVTGVTASDIGQPAVAQMASSAPVASSAPAQTVVQLQPAQFNQLMSRLGLSPQGTPLSAGQEVAQLPEGSSETTATPLYDVTQ